MSENLEPPRWVHSPTHMKGWEAFGVSDREPTVRRLGVGFDGKGKPGTEKFHPSEIKDGVCSVEISTYADHPDGAYIYVVGTEEKGVTHHWHAAAKMFDQMKKDLWG